MKAYQADIAKFEKTDSQIIAISVDSPFSNKKFAEENGITFPVLSDLSHKVSKQYGILMEDAGVARRTTFVVDKNGIIQHVEQDSTAIDPTGAHAVCSRIYGKPSE